LLLISFDFFHPIFIENCKNQQKEVTNLDFIWQALQRISTNSISIFISGAALLFSMIFFIWNRYHTNSLFEKAQYPDIDFQFKVNTCLAGKNYRKIDVSDAGFPEEFIAEEGRLPHHISIGVDFHNKTRVEAVNLYAILTLLIEHRRVKWKSSGLRMSNIPTLRWERSVITTELIRAMATICPECLKLGNKDSAALGGEWIEIQSLNKPIKFGLIADLRWNPPLWQGKLLGKSFGMNLILQSRKGPWTLEQKSRVMPLRIASWLSKKYALNNNKV
jgi:hypothetical protein